MFANPLVTGHNLVSPRYLHATEQPSATSAVTISPSTKNLGTLHHDIDSDEHYEGISTVIRSKWSSEHYHYW